MKKILTLAIVAVAMAFASGKALAYTFPWVPLNISATVKSGTVSANDNWITTQTPPMSTVSVNNKSIIAMLNLITHSNIPAGSQILWNPDYEDLLITNKNGFSMYPSDCYIEPDYEGLIGTYTKNINTSAGSENDLTGVYIELYFDSYNYIEAYGLANLNWTYAAAISGSQKTTLGAKISFQGSDDVYIDDYEGELTSGSASGSGATATDPVGQNPFVIWY
jgi:hypothetical protein